jgi:hypothetical protein
MDRLDRWVWGMETERRHPTKVVPRVEYSELEVRLPAAIVGELYQMALRYDKNPSEIAEGLLTLSIKDAMESMARQQAMERKGEAEPAV